MLQETESKRIETLKQMQVLCRSTPTGFTDKTRLDVIGQILKESPYQLLYDGSLSNVYAQINEEQLQTLALENAPIMIISTHVDTVPSITRCFCDLNEAKMTMMLRGTFDNTITNAACVNLMRYESLPQNVLFTFNGDEETGRCGGAAEVAKLLSSLGFTQEQLTVLALDVTHEGFEKQQAFTVENRYSDGSNDPFLQLLLDRFGEAFTYAAPFRAAIPRNLPAGLKSRQPSWYDEGVAYHRLGISNTCSLCLPCGYGDMHSNQGVVVYADSFLQYEQVLLTIAKEYEQTRSLQTQEEKEGEAYEISR